ncbi:nuclear transport factor 2 family protein [Streptomyces sp. DG1A-41]|uniref:nuclear transport factor 2 family protein n=1 Tax=Streptomyces sp. DG1A-41 TaxID=3125779 RepID=UPI0030CF9A7D
MDELDVVSEGVGAEDVATGDLVGRFCAAVAAGDVDAVIETMAEDAEMVTPLSSRVVIRGRDDLRAVFAAFLPSLSRDLNWRLRIGNADTTVAVAEARLGGVRVEDAMLIEQDADGRIRRVTPHVRPWLGLTVSAIVLGPKLMRHPGVVRRAMRRK